MVNVSTRGLLGAGAGGLAAASVLSRARAAGFGNPDLPPQGAINATDPASLTDPGPQNPAIADPWLRRRGGVPGFTACFRTIELGGRHDGRAGHHAGLCRVSHPALASPAGHDGTVFCRRRPRDRRHQALILSKVALSLILPVPMIALIEMVTDSPAPLGYRSACGRFSPRSRHDPGAPSQRFR
jgi:hypothetical protein